MTHGARQHKSLLALVASSVVICLLSCVERAEDRAAPSLGDSIAGIWLGTYSLDVPDYPQIAFITTYHADGTASTTSARAFGAGNPEKYGLSSAHHTQWTAMGPREIEWRILHFGHDADGTLEFISRTYGVTQFDERFEHCTGSLQVEIFDPEDLLDPLDPNSPAALPKATATGTTAARRLHVRIPDRPVPSADGVP
jgi:hypothetical protein